MDCKHEIFRVNWARGVYECMGKGCHHVLVQGQDIVILPKAQHDKMVAVVEVGKKVRKFMAIMRNDKELKRVMENHKANAEFWEMFDIAFEQLKALDALRESE